MDSRQSGSTKNLKKSTSPKRKTNNAQLKVNERAQKRKQDAKQEFTTLADSNQSLTTMTTGAVGISAATGTAAARHGGMVS